MITKNWFVIIRTGDEGLEFLSQGEEWTAHLTPECLYKDAQDAYADANVHHGKVNMVTLTLRPITE